MTRLLLTGGRQRFGARRSQEWHVFAEARIVELDTETGALTERFGYRTPAELCPASRPSHVFKSASWDEERLAVVTQTEVLILDPVRMRIVEHHSHPWFNDLHHVARVNGLLHVVSTGLDTLIVLDGEGKPFELRHAMEGSPWERFDPERDYRRLPTTKPHAAHPNYVFATAEGTWLTRLEQKDAVCLDRPSLRIPLDAGHPHDGLLHGGSVWFTTVTGHLVEADPATGAVRGDLDLNELEAGGEPLGWCRGLHLENGRAFVGFSRFRHTTLRKHLSWLKHGLSESEVHRTRPTRIAVYDLERKTKLNEWDLEPGGMNAVFSVLEAVA